MMPILESALKQRTFAASVALVSASVASCAPPHTVTMTHAPLARRVLSVSRTFAASSACWAATTSNASSRVEGGAWAPAANSSR
eukprot:SAG31_NODE_1431_length_8376_cov_2.033829_2_plen_84_part_00